MVKSLASYLDALTNAPSIERLWSLHVDQMASYGFDRLIYGFTRYRSGTSLGDPQDWVVLTNQPLSSARALINSPALGNAALPATVLASFSCLSLK